MKPYLLGLLLVAGLANAECFVRSSTNITKSALGGQPTDMQKIIKSDAAGFKCILRYRILIDDEWATVEGEGQAKIEDLACARALDARKGYQLLEPTRERVSSDQLLICTDLREIRIRPVKPGEIIWESETDIHRIGNERGYFNYKDTRCRMFTERNARDGNLLTYQGVICQADSKTNSKWRVVDKY
jgi:hypothetical protein